MGLMVIPTVATLLTLAGDPVSVTVKVKESLPLWSRAPLKKTVVKAPMVPETGEPPAVKERNPLVGPATMVLIRLDGRVSPHESEPVRVMRTLPSSLTATFDPVATGASF